MCHTLRLQRVTFQANPGTVKCAKLPRKTLHIILLKIESACMLMKLGSSNSVFCKESEYVFRFDMQVLLKIVMSRLLSKKGSLES
jgi:hypothetical protein